MELDFDKYKAQQCCDNPACQYNGKMGEDNIRTHSRQHQQVYCNACNNIWVLTVVFWLMIDDLSSRHGRLLLGK